MVADVTPGYHLKARTEFIKEPVGFIKAQLKYTPKNRNNAKFSLQRIGKVSRAIYRLGY
jgi:predicted GNAT superfamily acetyltransferase